MKQLNENELRRIHLAELFFYLNSEIKPVFKFKTIISHSSAITTLQIYAHSFQEALANKGQTKDRI